LRIFKNKEHVSWVWFIVSVVMLAISFNKLIGITFEAIESGQIIVDYSDDDGEPITVDWGQAWALFLGLFCVLFGSLFGALAALGWRIFEFLAYCLIPIGIGFSLYFDLLSSLKNIAFLFSVGIFVFYISTVSKKYGSRRAWLVTVIFIGVFFAWQILKVRNS
jgi:hypothetical protein